LEETIEISAYYVELLIPEVNPKQKGNTSTKHFKLTDFEATSVFFVGKQTPPTRSYSWRAPRGKGAN